MAGRTSAFILEDVITNDDGMIVSGRSHQDRVLGSKPLASFNANKENQRNLRNLGNTKASSKPLKSSFLAEKTKSTYSETKSIRQNLRDTVTFSEVKESKNARYETAAIMPGNTSDYGFVTTAQKMQPPSTPSSMLRTELQLDSSDDSFLFSPASVSSNASSKSITKNMRQMVKDTTSNTVNVSATTAMRQSKVSRPSLLNRYRGTSEVSNAQRGASRANDASDQSIVGITSEVRTMANKRVNVDNDSTKSRTNRSSIRFSPAFIRRRQSSVRKSALPKTPVADLSALSEGPDSTLQPVENYASDTKSRAICMDLSNMFQEAQSVSKKGKQLTSIKKKNMTNMSSSNANDSISASLATQPVKADHLSAEWAENQCEVFAAWLNYIFYPDESGDSSDDFASGNNSSYMGHRDLLLHQTLAQARKASLQVFQSEFMQSVRNSLEHEITRGRLKMRPDRQIHADLQWRKHLTAILLSYSSPWLRLGLETLFTTTISPEIPHNFSPSSKSRSSKSVTTSIKTSLKAFILQRVLSDDRILAKYTHGKCKVPSGKFEAQYQEEMRQVVLYRVLVIVFFLDQAKQYNVLDKAPRLFVSNAVCKSSREVLTSFCRDYLWGQGDIIKSLGRLGLNVSYQQSKFDELDFTVTNLATDLRDGVCLTRLVEILTGQTYKSLLSKLRLPAVSRLQKLHNVQLLFAVLQNDQVAIGEDLSPHHIVDGHRQMFLKLMWSIVSHYCLDKLVSIERIDNEINRIQRYNHSYVETDEEHNENSSTMIEKKLFIWCKSVCVAYGENISNMCDDMADGRIICFLVHFYHPTLVKLSDIKPTTRSWPRDRKYNADTALMNELANNRMLNKRLSELGGIPQIVPQVNSQTPPDRASILLCLAYMFTRLLDTSCEVQAVLKLQKTYRSYLHDRIRRQKVQSARTIVKYWVQYEYQYRLNQMLKYGPAVATIETFMLRHKAQLSTVKRLRLHRIKTKHAVVKVQSFVRGSITRKEYNNMLLRHFSCCVIQNRWRIHIAKMKLYVLRKVKYSATTIQRLWRGFRVRSERKHAAALTIQTCWRVFWAQLQYQIDVWDIITVQSCARRFIATRNSRAKSAAVVKIQSALRMSLASNFTQQLRYQQRRHNSAICCQRIIRGFVARQILSGNRHKVAASLIIQKMWRGYKEKRKYNIAVGQVILLQSLFRKALVARWFMATIKSITLFQAVIRTSIQHSSYTAYRNHVIVIQSACRRFLTKSRLATSRTAAVRLQQTIRQFSAKLRKEQLVQERDWRIENATVLQSTWRRYRATRQFAVTVKHVIHMQAFSRMVLAIVQARKRYGAAILVQSFGRLVTGKQTARKRRIHVDKLIASATLIQSIYRRHLLRNVLSLTHRSATVIQRAYKQFCAYQQLRTSSATTIQCLVRRHHAELRYHYVLSQVIRLQHSIRRLLKTVRTHEYAATTIQSCFRMYLVRREYCYVSRQVTVIQSNFRRYWLRMQYTNALYHIVTIQSLARRWLDVTRTQKMRAAILRLQCWNRRFIAVKKLNSLVTERTELHSAVKIQCLYRVYSARLAKQYRQHIRSATVSIQSQWRVYRAHQVYVALSYKRRLVRSANCIQRIYRGYNGRRLSAQQFAKVSQRRSAVKIQCQYRGWVCRQMVNRMRRLKMENDSATVIQSHCRSLLAKIELCRLRIVRTEYSSAKAIQSQFRGFSARKYVANEVQQLLEGFAAITIQRVFHGYQAKKVVRLHSAARKVQKTWRCYFAHVNFLLAVLSAIQVQKLVRCYVCKQQYKRQIQALTRVQSFARLSLVRKRMTHVTEAATSIQSIYRRHRARVVYKSYIQHCIIIQKHIRGWQARSTLELEHFAATEIQKIWRSFDKQSTYLVTVLSVVKIQSTIRRKSAVIILHQLRNEQLAFEFLAFRSAVKIQQCFRLHLFWKHVDNAVCRIQLAYRRFKLRLNYLLLRSGTLALQSMFRGWKSRRVATKAIRVVALRIQKANIKAELEPRLQLRHRTTAALAIIKSSTSLSEIMAAVCTLEVATRYSKECCFAFVNTSAPATFFSLIRSCNRSLPHIELLNAILLTMTNVAQFDESLIAIASRSGIEIFLDLVQMFRDKDNVFCLAVSLLEQCLALSIEFQNICQSRENLKRLKGVYALSMRKLSTSSVDNRLTRSERKSRSQRPRTQISLRHGVQSLHRVIRMVDN